MNECTLLRNSGKTWLEVVPPRADNNVLSPEGWCQLLIWFCLYYVLLLANINTSDFMSSAVVFYSRSLLIRSPSCGRTNCIAGLQHWLLFHMEY